MNKKIHIFFFSTVLVAFPLLGYQNIDAQNALARAQHEIENLNYQMTTLEKKIAFQDTTIETLRSNLLEEQEKLRLILQNRFSELSKKIEAVASNDFDKKIQTHLSGSNEILEAYQKRIYQLENQLQAQSSAMKDLKNSLTSVLDYLQSDSKTIASSTPANNKTYQVRSGDSLSEISKKFNISIEAIKNANNKKSDTIIVGETLKIP